ncbi:MAG: hemerythrin domain-containing protein [Pseudomonadota bacterium]
MSDRQMRIISDLALADRKQLPDALRVLLNDFPRDAWAGHPNYSELITFWLDRHLMFRRLIERLSLDATSALDHAIGAEDYRRRLANAGGMLLRELHSHHQIEDRHYFPVMAALDQRVQAGFELLDKDHHDIDGLLGGFADSANAVLSANPNDKNLFQDAVAEFRRQLLAFDPILIRHLVDEEELVVPLLLKYAPEQFR